MAVSRVLCLAMCLTVPALVAAQWTPGTATFTGEDATVKSVPNGACGYGPLTTADSPGLALTGISPSKNPLATGIGKGCGQCVEVKCADKEACTDPNKSIIVMVHDACEVKCGANQLNLAATPFAQLASLNVGKIRIQYHAVPCAFSGGVTVRVDEVRASDGGWVRLVFKNVNGGPLEKVEITKAGTDGFRPMKNAFGAAWEASRLPAFPWDIRLTNTAGKSVVLPEAISGGASPGDIKTTKNF